MRDIFIDAYYPNTQSSINRVITRFKQQFILLISHDSWNYLRGHQPLKAAQGHMSAENLY